MAKPNKKSSDRVKLILWVISGKLLRIFKNHGQDKGTEGAGGYDTQSQNGGESKTSQGNEPKKKRCHTAHTEVNEWGLWGQWKVWTVNTNECQKLRLHYDMLEECFYMCN